MSGLIQLAGDPTTAAPAGVTSSTLEQLSSQASALAAKAGATAVDAAKQAGAAATDAASQLSTHASTVAAKASDVAAQAGAVASDAAKQAGAVASDVAAQASAVANTALGKVSSTVGSLAPSGGTPLTPESCYGSFTSIWNDLWTGALSDAGSHTASAASLCSQSVVDGIKSLLAYVM